MTRELLLKLEVGIHEGLRKPRSGSIQHMPAHVSFQRIQRLRFQHAVHLLEEIGIRDVELRKPGCADRREVAIQIEIGTERRRLVAAHLMVAVLRIAALGAVHRVCRKQGFNHQDGLRRLRRLLRTLACQGKQLRGVVDQNLTLLNFVGIILDIVIAVGQREPALVDVGNNLVRIMQVRLRVEIEQRVRPNQVYVRDLINQRTLIVDRSNAVQFRLYRRDSFSVERFLVHA